MATQPRWHLFLARALMKKNALVPGPNDVVTPYNPTSPGEFPENDFTGHAALNFGDLDGKYRGSVLSHWKNMRLNKAFTNIEPVIWVYNPSTLRELAAVLIDRYGLPMLPTWFVDGPFDPTVLPQEVELSTLRTHVSPLGDKIKVTVNRGNVDIHDLLVNSTLESPGVPYTVMTGRASAEVSYSVDFTPELPEQYRQLLLYPTDVIGPSQYEHPSVQLLVNLINQRFDSGKAYYSTGDAPDFNFSGSKLEFVGKPKDYVPAVNKPWSPRGDTAYDRVIVIKFSDSNVGRAGYGFFHFYEVS